MQVDQLSIDPPQDWRMDLTLVTQQLLGDTIALSDHDWQGPTSLPGWSRAHVATHLAHHGQALADMARTISQTHRSVNWRTIQPEADLNAGARRKAVALQEVLDRSAATLMSAFDLMDQAAWQTLVQTSQGPLPATVLIIDRLNQVVIHHIDLCLKFDFIDIDPGLVRLLLRWNLFRALPRFNRVELTIISDEGLESTIGQGRPITIRGNEPNILGWLTGRKDSSAVLGADDLDLAGPV